MFRKVLTWFKPRRVPVDDPNSIDVDAEVHSAVDVLDRLEAKIMSDFRRRIDARALGEWSESDDAIFLGHTHLCTVCWHNLIPQRAIRLWLMDMVDLVDEADRRIAQSGTGQPIHRGAPLYNVGVCFFMAGDLDRALQYLSQAGVSDEAIGRGDANQVLLGDHPLSRQLLRRTVAAWVSVCWGQSFQQATGHPLNEAEIDSLLRWLTVPDAVQVVVSLHRLAGLQVGPENQASRHLRVQALADLVLVFESTLRKWQPSGLRELMDRVHTNPNALLRQNLASRAGFQTQWDRQNAEIQAGRLARNTTAALDWTVADSLAEFAAASTTATRAGIACYVTYQLRNSLMHVIDGSIALYSDQAKLMAAAGLVMAAIRISQHGAMNTLGGL